MLLLLRFVVLVSFTQLVNICAGENEFKQAIDEDSNNDYEMAIPVDTTPPSTSETESAEPSAEASAEPSAEPSVEPESVSRTSSAQNTSEPYIELFNSTQCSSRRQGSDSVHEIMVARPDQFPYVVSIKSSKDEHLCSGTIVGNGIILTTATCVMKPTAYVFLNNTGITKKKYNIKNNEKFPTYSAEVGKNVAILYTEAFNISDKDLPKLKISNFTNAHELTFIEAIGHGLNVEPGETKELQYVGLEIREPIGDFTVVGYIDCLDTKVPTCFKDTGGPAIYRDELIGIVHSGQQKCTKSMSSTYMANKFMVGVLPVFMFRSWLEDKLAKYTDTSMELLPRSGRRLEPASRDPFRPAQKKTKDNQPENRNIVPHSKATAAGMKPILLVFSIFVCFV